MKAIIVTCYESNEERVSFVLETLKSKGYQTEVITSDFSHIRKEKRNNVPDGYIALKTKPYSSNLSIDRLLSHRRFAKDAFKYVERYVPDLIWLVAPANSLIKQASIYKKKYPLVKLVIDVIDMWPESLPISINKNIFPLNLWRNIRTNNINCADYLVCECDLYQDILKNEYQGKIQTIHWARDMKAQKINNCVPNDKLSLCYIGSINNIISSDLICKMISSIDKPVVLHVIGEGENRYKFIDSLKRVCEVIYYGPIRDEEKKKEIFAMCHAGINIYRENLYIGLTVKSIDYFNHGLPVINNIKGDTWNLIDNYKVGINYSKDVPINSNEVINMRMNNKNIYKLYNDLFTKDVFIKKCAAVIDEVNK